MHRLHPLSAALAALFLLAACDVVRKPEPAQPPVDSAALFQSELEGPLACADPYTQTSPATRMVFSDVVQDVAGSGELEGMELALRDSVGVWVGRYHRADGDFGPWFPLLDLSLNPQSRNISFVLPADSDTARFTGTISCMRLNGELRAFQAAFGAPTMLPRVRHLWDEPN